MSMTRAEVIEFIERLSYKPGWELKADFDEMRGTARLTIRVDPVPDANDPSVPIAVGRLHQLGWLGHLSRERLLDEVSCALWKTEQHEFREWFRLDGEPVRDPHPEWVVSP